MEGARRVRYGGALGRVESWPVRAGALAPGRGARRAVSVAAVFPFPDGRGSVWLGRRANGVKAAMGVSRLRASARVSAA